MPSGNIGSYLASKFSIVMRIVLFLIILSLIMALGFLLAFFWAVKNGQYEDEYTPSIRPLIEDDMVQVKSKTK